MVQSVYEWWTEEVTGCAQDTFDTTTNAKVAKIAQVFKVGQRGINSNFVLSEVQLYLKKIGAPAGNLTVEIAAVDAVTFKPTTVLCTGTIAMTDISAAAFGYLSCTNFEGNRNLTAGSRYAVIISHPATATLANNIQWSGDDSADAGYQGYDANAHFWISFDAGSTWTKNSSFSDLESGRFIILGEAYSGNMAYYHDVINKVGSGANATAKSITNVGNYVVQAESVLNSRTQYNWTDEYSTLDEDVKYFINEIISDLAAIKVINYSHTGYNSRLEQQQMIDNLRAEAEDYIKELKNKDVQKFILAV